MENIKKLNSRISDKTRFDQHRGIGEKEGYTAWLKIRDFSSSGKNNRPPGMTINRSYELFSDLELSHFLMYDFAKNVVDIREQYPMDLKTTRAIAEELGIKHPPLNNKLDTVMTIDFLLTMDDGTYIASSIKPSSELLDKRVIALESISHEYFKRSGIKWLLQTEKELDPILSKNINLFWEHYFEKQTHQEKYLDCLRNRDWNSDITVQKLIKETSKECRIDFARGRRIFTQLIAKKVITFDYYKPFAINMPLYSFELK